MRHKNGQVENTLHSSAMSDKIYEVYLRRIKSE